MFFLLECDPLTTWDFVGGGLSQMRMAVLELHVVHMEQFGHFRSCTAYRRGDRLYSCSPHTRCRGRDYHQRFFTAISPALFCPLCCKHVAVLVTASVHAGCPTDPSVMLSLSHVESLNEGRLHPTPRAFLCSDYLENFFRGMRS